MDLVKSMCIERGWELHEVGVEKVKWAILIIRRAFGDYFAERCILWLTPLDDSYCRIGLFASAVGLKFNVCSLFWFIGLNFDRLLLENKEYLCPDMFMAALGDLLPFGGAGMWDDVRVALELGEICGDDCGWGLVEWWKLTRRNKWDFGAIRDFLTLKLGCFRSIFGTVMEYKTYLYTNELKYYFLD